MRHQRHSPGWYLAKDNGQRYCSGSSTSNHKSMYWNLPEPNFKQIVLSKDGASHFLYLLNSAYYDPSTSASDAEDPMVIINLDISNAFGTLCARLVLDHLSGKASRDYACGINADADFETAVHDVKAYFGFFRLQRTCETILRLRWSNKLWWSNKLCPVQNRWTTRRLPRVYDILTCYSTPLGSHIWEISRN